MIARLEHRSWVVVEREAAELASCSAQELLERGRSLPGTLRFTRRGRNIVLMGEQRTGPTTPDCEVLNGLLNNEAGDGIPSTELIESVIEASGLEWARREQSWAVLGGLREVRVSAVQGRVQLEAILADWDEIAPECTAALAEFLLRAQAAICFARCEITPKQARIVSQAQSANLDVDLLDALRGVTTGCQRLAREVEALLRPELARTYRAFHG